MSPGDEDTLDAILDLAGTVIDDYGPGDTRIQRLAVWIIANLGGEWPAPWWIDRVVTNELSDEPAKMGPGRKMTSKEAREFAAALLRAADKAE